MATSEPTHEGAADARSGSGQVCRVPRELVPVSPQNLLRRASGTDSPRRVLSGQLFPHKQQSKPTHSTEDKHPGQLAQRARAAGRASAIRHLRPPTARPCQSSARPERRPLPSEVQTDHARSRCAHRARQTQTQHLPEAPDKPRGSLGCARAAAPVVAIETDVLEDGMLPKARKRTPQQKTEKSA